MAIVVRAPSQRDGVRAARSVEQPDDDIRMIESDAPKERFARGWHCLGLLRDLGDGKPHAVHAFGTKLVAFRNRSGEMAVLDAYCRHMGGDLSQGEVKGDEIACPFHDWRWGADGRCKEIPYARRVPPRARTRTWLTMERNGQLFVWHDPEGNPPPPEVTIPEIPGYVDGQWTDWVWNTLEVPSPCRDIIDNVVDMAHFYYIHGGVPTYFKNVFEGHIATQYYNGTSHAVAASGDAIETGEHGFSTNRSEASYYGPSYMIDWLWDDFKGMTIETCLINCHYPVSPTSFVLMYGLVVKRIEGLPDDVMDKIASKMIEMIGAGFLNDVKIWQNKTIIANPLLCEEDGPVYQLRRWYEQFYVDAADVSPDMVRRFEFEVDTTKAVEFWQRDLVERKRRGEPLGIGH